MDLVVDASAVLAVLFRESAREGIIAATEGCELIAPGSLPFEIGNAVSAGMKRGRFDARVGTAAVEGFERMRIRLEGVDLARAVAIAARHRIYAYDAYVIEVASRRSTPLMTLDGGLRSAAVEDGVKIREVE